MLLFAGKLLSWLRCLASLLPRRLWSIPSCWRHFVNVVQRGNTGDEAGRGLRHCAIEPRMAVMGWTCTSSVVSYTNGQELLFNDAAPDSLQLTLANRLYISFSIS